MRISELEHRTGVPARLLRYYEDQGLLTPHRDARGWRVYTGEDQGRVLEIRELLDAGLPTVAIRRLLDRPVTGGCSAASKADADFLAELIEFRNRLDARVRCLARNRDALDAWLQQAKRPVS